MVIRTKEFWTTGLDEAINFPYDRHMNHYNDFLQVWCEVFGEDLETEQQKLQDNIDDRLTLGIIDKCYNMGVIDNFRYISALKRLAMSGQIKKVKTGWGVKK